MAECFATLLTLLVQIGTTIARASFKESFGIDKMTASQKTNLTTNITSVFTGAAFFGAVASW